MKQSIALLSYRKKSTTLLVAILTLSVFLIVGVLPIFAAVNRNTFESYVEVYGLQHGIYFDLRESQIEELRAHTLVDKVGLLKNYGNYEIAASQQTITLGTYDETAWELGRLSLEEGRLPETAYEIAVERHYLYMLPENSGIGSKLTVVVDNKEVSFTICGILKDYRANWDKAQIVVTGKNDLPGGLLLDGTAMDKDGTTAALVYLHTLRYDECPDSQFLQIADAIFSGPHDETRVLFNDALYWTMQYAEMRPVRIYQGIFTLIAWIGVGIIFYISIFAYFRPCIQSAQMLYMLGASHRIVTNVFMGCGVLLAGSSLVLGAGCSLLFSKVMQKIIGITWNPLENWPTMVALFTAILLVCLLFVRFKISTWKGKSFSQTKEQKKMEALAVEGDFHRTLAAKHIQQNWKRLSFICLVTAALFAVQQCIQWDIKWRAEGFQGEKPYIAASPTSWYATQYYGDFTLDSASEYYSIQTVQQLEDIENALAIVKKYEGVPASLIIEDVEDPYWQYWYVESRDTLSQELGLSANMVPSIPQDIVAMREHYYTVVVLDEAMQQSFFEAYPEFEKKDLANGKAVVFCPPIERADGTVLQNTTLQTGESIRFGFLEMDQDFQAAMNDPALLQYSEETLQVAQVCNTTYALQTPYTNDAYHDVTVVISEQTAQGTSFANQIGTVYLYYDPQIGEQEYKQLEEMFSRVAMQAQGTEIGSTYEMHKFIDRLHSTIRSAFLSAVIILAGFSIFVLCSVIYSTLLQRQRMFGILRANGFAKKDLFLTVFREMVVYWIVLILITYTVTLISVYQFSFYVCNPVMQTSDMWMLAGETGVFGMLLLGILTGIAWLITRSIFKKSISTCIRFAE